MSEVQSWISVDERLPEPDPYWGFDSVRFSLSVLVYDGKQVQEAVYKTYWDMDDLNAPDPDSTPVWEQSHGDYEAKGVTHWMPMPGGPA